MTTPDRPNLIGTAICEGPNDIKISPAVGLQLAIDATNTLRTNCGNFNPETRGCLPAEKAKVENPACVVFSLVKVEAPTQIILKKAVTGVGEIVLNTQTGQIRLENRVVELRPKQLDVFAVLMKAENVYLTTTQIYERARGPIQDEGKTKKKAAQLITTYLNNIRGIIGDTKNDEGNFRIIKVKKGKGYYINEPTLTP